MASGCGVALQLQTPSMSSFLIKQRVPAHKRRPGWEDGSDESDESDERVNLMAAERPRRSMRRRHRSVSQSQARIKYNQTVNSSEVQ